MDDLLFVNGDVFETRVASRSRVRPQDAMPWPGVEVMNLHRHGETLDNATGLHGDVTKNGRILRAGKA